MGTLDDIKSQVEKLPTAERVELLSWLSDLDHADWDQQIARDLSAGKLDALIAETDADRKAGHGRDL